MNYFDHSATTQPLPEVMGTYQQVATQFFANPSSAHELGQRARQLLEQARKQVAEILSYRSDEIYFASSGTEVNNWVIKAVAPSYISGAKKATLITTSYEHPSIRESVQYLQSSGHSIEYLPIDSSGACDYETLEKLLTDKPIGMLSTMGVNNEVGSLLDFDRIAKLLEPYPQVIWHVDAVQCLTTQLDSILHPRIDMLTLSGHKFHSGRGTGILACRQRVNLLPFLDGGGQEMGMRSSTENLASIVATAKALRLTAERQAVAKATLVQFKDQIIHQLSQYGWQLFNPTHSSEHIICAALPPIPGEVLVHAFEENEIYLSTTSACSSRKHQPHATLRAMGVNDVISQSAIRISLSQHTSPQEVDSLIQAIAKVSQQLQLRKES